MTFPQLDNPWFSGHNHENKADPLDLNWPEDYDNHTVNSCSYREFKNVTVFSHAEFIHDYINFRHCIGRSQLDDWIKSNLIAETGKVFRSDYNFLFPSLKVRNCLKPRPFTQVCRLICIQTYNRLCQLCAAMMS